MVSLMRDFWIPLAYNAAILVVGVVLILLSENPDAMESQPTLPGTLAGTVVLLALLAVGYHLRASSRRYHMEGSDFGPR